MTIPTTKIVGPPTNILFWLQKENEPRTAKKYWIPSKKYFSRLPNKIDPPIKFFLFIASVILSALVERFSVSRVQDFYSCFERIKLNCGLWKVLEFQLDTAQNLFLKCKNILMRTRPDADLMHKVGSKGIRDVIAQEQALTRNTL